MRWIDKQDATHVASLQRTGGLTRKAEQGPLERTQVLRSNDPRLEVFSLLVDAGVDVNATDKTGCSVLDWYLGDRNLPPRTKAMVIDFLRGRGAKSGKELHGGS